MNFVLVKDWYPVDDHPRNGTTKVDEFVHEKGHDTSGEDIIADVGVPSGPHALKVVEMNIVL